MGFIPDKEQNSDRRFASRRKLFEELLNDTSKTLPTHHEKIMIAE
jgi:hypothetical protein